MKTGPCNCDDCLQDALHRAPGSIRGVAIKFGLHAELDAAEKGKIGGNAYDHLIHEIALKLVARKNPYPDMRLPGED